MRAAFAGLLMLGLAAGPGRADCGGDGYLAQLSTTERRALDQASAAQPYGEGLIWDATRDGQVITLVGTIHIHDPRLADLRGQIAADIAAADLVLLEATPAEERALEQLLADRPEMVLITQGPTLPDLLDPATWALLTQAAGERGVPGFMAAQMQPWYLSLLLAIPPCAMPALAQGATGLDQMIGADALAAGVPLAALEPITTLFDLFQQDPIATQIDMLRLGIASAADQEAMFVSMLEGYFAGQVAQIWEMSRLAARDVPGLAPERGLALFAQMEQDLLVGRNHAWMPVIAAAMQEHDTVIAAFGAAHLIGAEGIPALLARQGWTLTRRY